MSEIKLPKMHKPPLPEGYRLPDYDRLSRYAPLLAVENVASTCFAAPAKRQKPSYEEQLSRFVEQEGRIAARVAEQERIEAEERKRKRWAWLPWKKKR